MEQQFLSWVIIITWVMLLINVIILFRVVNIVNKIAEHFQARNPLTIGQQAPDFDATMVTGEPITLKSFHGQSVVFIFISPSCGVCAEKLPIIEKLSTIVRQRAGVLFVLVSESDFASTKTFMTQYNVTLPLIVAPRHEYGFGHLYNPDGNWPYYCLINKEGFVQSRSVLGDHEWLKLEQQWKNIPTDSHAFVLQ